MTRLPRADDHPHQQPDPSQIDTLDDLIAALETLRRLATDQGGELTLERLTRFLDGKASRSTVYAIFGGKRKRLPRLDVFTAILGVLGIEPRGQTSWVTAYWRVKDQRWLRASNQADEAAERTGRAGTLSWVIAGVAAAIALGSFAVVREGYATFYTVLSVRLGELPIGLPDILFPMLLVSVVATLISALLLAAVALGVACVPWTRPTRATIPTQALAMLVWGGGVVAYVLIPDSWISFLVVFTLSMSLFGLINQIGLIKGYRSRLQKAARDAAGTLLFLCIAAASTLIVKGSLWIGFPAPWPLALAGVWLATAAGALAWWLWRELRGDDQQAAQAPAIGDLFSGLRDATLALVGRRQRWSDRVRALAMLVVAVGLLVWVTVDWVDGRAAAGRVVVQLGYLPSEHGSFIMDTPIQPATITLRRSLADPFEVCQASTPWAASLLFPDGASNWVLLRPLEGNPQGPTTLRLPESNYIVRLEYPTEPRRNPDGTYRPWERVACRSR